MRIRQLTLVIATVVTLCAAYSTVHAQDVKRSVWDGVYTVEQANRGLSQYNDHCLDCHGEDLEGDAETPPLRGGTFLTNWDGQRLGDLYLRIRRDMPLNFEAGKLSPAVNADLVAYILSINRFPPGAAELPHAAEVLNQIRIEGDRGGKKP
jgi:mono/diheme cytochrome c family protein